jgi:hypothetical protein
MYERDVVDAMDTAEVARDAGGWSERTSNSTELINHCMWDWVGLSGEERVQLMANLILSLDFNF